MRIKKNLKFYFIIILFVFSVQAFGSDQTLSDRIVSISASFLNKPYQLDPLGEGAQGQFSQKPLYRFDRFDCQTYVETVLALALSDSTSNVPTLAFQNQLLEIRYSNGKPDFYTRNHFPSADWIPNNIEKGYIKYSPINNDKISIIINKQKWFENQTHIQNPEIPNKLRVTLPYISVDQLPNMINKIPNGSIIMIVKPSFVLISHMGFAIWKNNTLYLRSASSLYDKVIDLPLLAYIENQSKFGVKGIVVLIPGDSNN